MEVVFYWWLFTWYFNTKSQGNLYRLCLVSSICPCRFPLDLSILLPTLGGLQHGPHWQGPPQQELCQYISMQYISSPTLDLPMGLARTGRTYERAECGPTLRPWILIVGQSSPGPFASSWPIAVTSHTSPLFPSPAWVIYQPWGFPALVISAFF